MINKVNPIKQSYRPGSQGHGQDQSKEQETKKKKDGTPDFGPAVVSHVVSRELRAQMKQLQLPLQYPGRLIELCDQGNIVGFRTFCKPVFLT